MHCSADVMQELRHCLLLRQACARHTSDVGIRTRLSRSVEQVTPAPGGMLTKLGRPASASWNSSASATLAACGANKPYVSGQLHYKRAKSIDVVQSPHLDGEVLLAVVPCKLQEPLRSRSISSVPGFTVGSLDSSCMPEEPTARLYGLQRLLRHQLLDGAHHAPRPRRLAACCGLNLRPRLCMLRSVP